MLPAPAPLTAAPTLEVEAFFAKYDWPIHSANITGLNDEQKLPDSFNAPHGGYGPRVRLYVSPRLREYSVDEFDAPNGVLVGVAEVWKPAHAMPAAYQHLNFDDQSAKRLYCIYLKHASGQPEASGWDGYVTHFDPASVCDSPSNSTHLDVDVDDDGGTGGVTEFPPVIRLNTDRNGFPSIGVSCLSAWCELGHTRKDHRPPSHLDVNHVQGRVKAWRDEQVLSEPDPSGTGVRPWGLATITPVPDLESIRVAAYHDTWQPVANIWLDATAAAPSQTSHYSKWNLVQGHENSVWLEETGGKWFATFTVDGARPGPTPATIPIKRTPWTVRVPGVARFVWDDADDSFWVACDQGCCSPDLAR